MAIRLFDNTRTSTYRNCPRLFYYRHIRHLSGAGLAPALVFGSAWHEAVDVVWKLASTTNLDERTIYEQAYDAFINAFTVELGRRFEDLPDDTHDNFKKKLRTPDVANKMLQSYTGKRVSQIRKNYELVAIEQPFIVPTSIDNVLYVGRIDKVLLWKTSDGRTWGLDHKSTTKGSGKSGFYNSWTDSWSPNSQMDGYTFAGRMLYKDFAGMIIDGTLVNNAAQHEATVTVSKADDVLDTWLFDLETTVDNMLLDYERLDAVRPNDPIMRAYPKNSNNCFSFNHPCTFINYCRSTANPHGLSDEQFLRDERLIIKPWSPFNETDLSSFGLTRENTNEPPESSGAYDDPSNE